MEDKKKEAYQEKLDELLEFVANELKVGKQVTEAKLNGVRYKITEAFLLIEKLQGKIEILENELRKEREKASSAPQLVLSYAQVTGRSIGVPGIQKPKRREQP